MSKSTSRIIRVDDARKTPEIARTADARTSAASPGQGGGSWLQAALLAAVLLPALLAAIVVSVWNWNHIGGVALDRAGYVALAIGVVATLSLGIGLMFLVFYSNRHNYDDGAKGS